MSCGWEIFTVILAFFVADTESEKFGMSLGRWRKNIGMHIWTGIMFWEKKDFSKSDTNVLYVYW